MAKKNMMLLMAQEMCKPYVDELRRVRILQEKERAAGDEQADGSQDRRV